MFKSIGCIVNPFAGGGSALNALKKVKEKLKSTGVDLLIEISHSAEHMTELARELGTKCEVVAAVGGDGTVNRVANGIIGTEAVLAVIPNGSGNDFASLLSLPSGIPEAMEVTVRGLTKLLDVGMARIDDSGLPIFFLNTLGVGFDAAAAYEAHDIKHLKGLPLYMLGLVRALAKFNPVELSLSADEKETRSGRYYLACAANGEREGGGFRIAPGASPFDGMLDYCLVRDVPLRRIPGLITDVLRGQHKHRSDVEYLQAKHAVIVTRKAVPIHADGEIYAEACSRIEIDVRPSVLRAVVGSAD